MPIKLICYDLDGVLLDACDWHYEALNNALETFDYPTISRLDHDTKYNGLPTKTKLKMLGVPPELHQHVFESKQRFTVHTINRLATIDAQKVFLHQFTTALGIKSVCVTNSIRDTAKLMLEKTGQAHLDIISNEDVRNPKPHGEGYIRAMIKYGAMPEETLIVEDSAKGRAAAYSTGALVWEVNNSTEVNKDNFYAQYCNPNGRQWEPVPSSGIQGTQAPHTDSRQTDDTPRP